MNNDLQIELKETLLGNKTSKHKYRDSKNSPLNSNRQVTTPKIHNFEFKIDEEFKEDKKEKLIPKKLSRKNKINSKSSANFYPVHKKLISDYIQLKNAKLSYSKTLVNTEIRNVAYAFLHKKGKSNKINNNMTIKSREQITQSPTTQSNWKNENNRIFSALPDSEQQKRRLWNTRKKAHTRTKLIKTLNKSEGLYKPPILNIIKIEEPFISNFKNKACSTSKVPINYCEPGLQVNTFYCAQSQKSLENAIKMMKAHIQESKNKIEKDRSKVSTSKVKMDLLFKKYAKNFPDSVDFLYHLIKRNSDVEQCYNNRVRFNNKVNNVLQKEINLDSGLKILTRQLEEKNKIRKPPSNPWLFDD